MIRSLLVTLGFLLSATQAMAAGGGFAYEDYCEELHPGCGAGSAFLIQFASRVIDIVSEVIGAAAVVFFLWGAFKMVSSAGNDEGRNEGKNIMIAACVGVALAILGEGLVIFVSEYTAEHASGS
jgi:TRAP-type C4-dicarboxylate transport system permease small subunit